jgi:hypothetical protein
MYASYRYDVVDAGNQLGGPPALPLHSSLLGWVLVVRLG